MPKTAEPTTLFEDAIDVPLWLESDRGTPFPQRVRRDRDIARRLDAGDAAARVRAWWRLVRDGSTPSAGLRLQRVRQLVSVGMAAAGALAGLGVALTAFHYDGTYPVNVVRLLALLVVPQLVLLALTALLIPGNVRMLRPLQEALAAINPGALAAAVFRRLAQPPPDYAALFGWHAGRSGAAARFAKWQLLHWSQVAAVAFNLAALATGGVLVAFTDLAFGWSTTLAADTATVERLVRVIAWPWHAAVPGAVPDASLIERSQFFRLNGDTAFGAMAPRQLAGWWSFALLAIVTYGLLPRYVLLLVAAHRLRAATRGLLIEDPRVTALLDRMSTPEIETASSEPERPPPAPHEATPAAPHPQLTGGPARAVIWGQSLEPDGAHEYARRHFGLELTAVAEAGAGHTLHEDREALESICAGGEVPTLVVFTRAWEPPLLEFLDYLKALRARCGDRTSIIVAPVPEARAGVSELERDTWARAIGRLADPRVYLEPGAA